MDCTIKPGGHTRFNVFLDGVTVATLTSEQVCEAIRDLGHQVMSIHTFDHLLDGYRKAACVRKVAEADTKNPLSKAIIDILDNA